MADTSTENTSTQEPPDWFVRACKWLWKKRGFFWGTISLSIALNVIASLLFIRWPLSTNKNLDGTLIGWFIQNPIFILVAGLFLLLLMCIIYLGSRFNVNVAVPNKKANEVLVDSAKEGERRYLQRMIRETENLTLKGIPAGLMAQGVPLGEIFIPLQFKPNRPLSDYPLTQEERKVYRDLLKRGILSEEMECVLFEAEKDWQQLLKRIDRITIADLWQQLTRNSPAAVIQGVPGIGKSTLMERMTLYMARCGLKQPDPYMPEPQRMKPTLVPILLRLKEYAGEREQTPGLSLENYLESILAKLNIPSVDVSSWVLTCLKTGRCLFMLDGLDEVSDPTMRKQVQEAIKTFILDHLDTSEKDFNRFLITSRVAGYDQEAFPNYIHYTVAELSSEQIEDFLPRWCRASVSRNRGAVTSSSGLIEQDETIAREAEQLAGNLSTALRNNQGVRGLAENPLLLTLLAVMQLNSIELPRQRVELYSVVTRTLLENRNIAKGLPQIPEALAIRRLGPLAFRMQETRNSFARQKDVVQALTQAIASEGGTPDQVAEEAGNFLSRIRERGGLFILRTGDYFGFFHRTFQEYFAARYMLNNIKEDPAKGIAELASRARRTDDLWREPFLLAVAYQSNENEKVASDIIRALLPPPQNANQEQKEHDLLLAADCLIEAKPLSIESALEKQVAHQLLQIYEEAQQRHQFNACKLIEAVMRRWLLSLPGEAAYRLPLLAVLRQSIGDTSQIARQRAVLTLLTMIAQQLDACHSSVFEMLIPPLLALAGLSAIGEHRPAADVPAVSDFNVADLALTVLSFMGKRGPAGLLLAEVRQYFKDHPAHLRLLARYSLECGTLLTLAVVPLAEENYQRYEATIEEWIKLLDSHKIRYVTEQEIDTCLYIHQALLDCAEEACYPAAIHLLKMLQASAEHPDQPWQENWQSYLLDQLKSCQYIAYQETVLVWVSLFPQEPAQARLASLLLHHYNSDGTSVQRYAQRFLGTLSTDLRVVRLFEDLRALGDVGFLRALRIIQGLRYLHVLRDLRDIRYLCYMQVLKSLQVFKSLRKLQDIRFIRDLRGIRDLLLVNQVASKAVKLLSYTGRASLDLVEQIELLTILLGRVLQVQKANESGHDVEREIQEIVQIIQPIFTSTRNDEISGIVLDILSYLPARSANEIEYVLQLINDATDERIQIACASALRYASPGTPEAWTALEVGRQSKVEVVRKAVGEGLERRR